MALRDVFDSSDGKETPNLDEEMGGLAAVGAEGETEMSRRKEQLAVVDDVQQEQQQQQVPRSVLRRSLGVVGRVLLWMPPSCRYDPVKPPEFTMGLNMLFSFATTATVGNLYYNQPILYQIADTFDVSYERSSIIATLMQAGYATGIVLLCPIGDVLPRRPMILALVALTALLWLGLCLTDSFAVFSGLSYICGFTTVTPQLMLPLVGDLAPPHRRAAALAIVVSGLSLGMLVARVVAGLVANYTSWRNVYWFSFGAQAVVLASLFCFMPDYPTKNSLAEEAAAGDESAGRGRSRTALHQILRLCRVLYGGIVMLLVRQPTLVQACLIVYCLSAVFTSYWTTLSFLLASPPYNYPSFAIGLFGLIGIVIICFGPFYGRFVIDRIVPTVAVLLGNALEITGVAIGVGIGTFSVAGPVIQAIFIDFGNQCSNIALRTSIYGLAPKAQNRINAAYMIASFTGQLSGSAAGNRLYAQGGWRYSGALSLGFLGFATLICLARGPRETGWVGWHGGWSIRKDSKPTKPVSAESSGEEGVVSDAVQEKVA
ncbi:major facilitator superfamily transporter dha1 transporter [Grosmannia clavigera kw1407]|uniref:Major facilitator superfamily transporter dha1 transporter n=1 Tax=Grosmannia clavigera (strain kw1407 / UAMH 11150) TaxID=655863 RepID=F0XPC2_GROCL|nr:major facilitator superfamily transporter dha1 transporter [Grosmannia clavigera kw1407]EFX00714.1 major facilitator superfamily transporter dha1 transporter [Grosmannia clavigera kw1407]